MLSEKRGESIFLDDKAKVSLKSNLFQRKKHPFDIDTLIHIAYACRNTFNIGNKKKNFTFKQQYLYINMREWMELRMTY